MSEQNVIIVSAGIGGLSAGCHAAMYGDRVPIFDQYSLLLQRLNGAPRAHRCPRPVLNGKPDVGAGTPPPRDRCHKSTA